MAFFDLVRKNFTNQISTFICKLPYVLIFLIHQKSTITFGYNFDLLKYQTLLYTLFIPGLCFKIYYIGHIIFKEIYEIHSHKFLIFYLGGKTYHLVTIIQLFIISILMHYQLNNK